MIKFCKEMRSELLAMGIPASELDVGEHNVGVQPDTEELVFIDYPWLQ